MTVTAQSDAELLAEARAGGQAAFTELYVRHHAAAQRLAQGYRRLGDPDDLVNGAFERVLAALKRGSGPTESFRAYLFVTLRHLAMEQARHAADESLDEVPEPVAAVAGDPELDGAERDIIAQAFDSLPGPWQTVLWQTAVEGKQPKDFAGTMGMTPNAAAALAYRARERLRQAYLQAHLQQGGHSACEPHRSRLGGYVRGGLSRRQERATREHLSECESCSDLVGELSDVNRMLVRTVAPIFMLASGGKLAASMTAGSTAALPDAVANLTDAASSVASGVGGSSPLGGGLVTGAADSGRRVGKIAGALVAAAATVISLSVTLLPHDAGPADGAREVDVQTDAGPSDGKPAVRRSTTTAASATTAPPASTGAPTTTTSAPSSSTPPPAAPGGSSASGSGAGSTTPPTVGIDAGVGIGVDVGDGQVAAQVDLRLSAHWTTGLRGGGTLDVNVASRSQVTASGLTVDLSLASGASLSGPVVGCQTTAGGIVGGVLSGLREVACPLLDIVGGGSTDVGFPVLLTLDATATVTLRHDGQVVDTVTVPLTR